MKKDISKLTDEEITEVFVDAVRNAIERNRKAGKPVCGFDSVLKKSYILYPDGRKEYACGEPFAPVGREEIYAELEESRACFERGEYEDFGDVLSKLREQGLREPMELDEINSFISETREQRC